MENKPQFSVVIPTYNEASKREEMKKHFESIEEYFSAKKFSYEILVVLDGPTDETPDLVKDLATKFKNVKVIDRKENKGKGHSVREGLLAANGDIRLFTDMDGATPIAMLDRFIPKFEAGADIVIGSRDLSGSKIKKHQPKWKEIAGDIGNLMIQLMTGLYGIKDTQCGFKAMNEKAVKDIVSRMTVERWGFDFEMLMIGNKLGYRIEQVPVDWYDKGDSTVGISGYITTLKDLFTVKWNMIKGVYKLKEKMEVENKNI
mgnify:CR=1 FL=1